MSTLSLAYSVDVVSEQCITCGVIFGVPSTLLTQRRRDHGNFYCPNGHSQHYPGESDVERAERLLREEKRRHQSTLARENAERETKLRLERKLKRVGRGVCPDCNRSFANLAKHMNCKHGGTDGKFGKPKLP